MYALQRKSLFYEAKINSCVGGKKKSGLKRQRKLDEGEDIDKKNKIGSGKEMAGSIKCVLCSSSLPIILI